MTKEEIIKKLRDMARYPTVTMPRDTEALRNAADLLEQAQQSIKAYKAGYDTGFMDASVKLKEQAEPVAWMCADESLINKGYARFSHVCMGDWKIPVYTSPPPRQPLTDEEILDVNMSTVTKLIDEPIICDTDHNIIQFTRAIEAKLKEKNT